MEFKQYQDYYANKRPYWALEDRYGKGSFVTTIRDKPHVVTPQKHLGVVVTPLRGDLDEWSQYLVTPQDPPRKPIQDPFPRGRVASPELTMLEVLKSEVRKERMMLEALKAKSEVRTVKLPLHPKKRATDYSIYLRAAASATATLFCILASFPIPKMIFVAAICGIITVLYIFILLEGRKCQNVSK